MLLESRQNLQRQIAAEHVPAHAFIGRAGWWDRLLDARWLQSAGALALLSIGFFGARLLPGLGLGVTGMSMVDPGAQRVRSVEPGPNGGIQIVLDETHQRIVSGGLDDQNIRVLLLSAAKDPSDPGLRYETVGILNDRAQAAEVRDTLIYAVIKERVVAGSGFGLRYNTPVGPLRFDLGFKWGKTLPQDARAVWYLTLGNAF